MPRKHKNSKKLKRVDKEKIKNILNSRYNKIKERIQNTRYVKSPYNCLHWDVSNVNIGNFIAYLQETINKLNVYKGKVLIIAGNTNNIMQGKFDSWVL